jgi:hypothetical protein
MIVAELTKNIERLARKKQLNSGKIGLKIKSSLIKKLDKIFSRPEWRSGGP